MNHNTLPEKKVITKPKTDVKKDLGYGVLDALINDRSVSDIKILAYDNIHIKRNGKRERSKNLFNSEEDYHIFLGLIKQKSQQFCPQAFKLIQQFIDRDSYSHTLLRISLIQNDDKSLNNSYLHIRKIAKHKKTSTDLVNSGELTKEQQTYLVDKLQYACGIIFVGKGGSGKTTLLNALLEHIPQNKQGWVIQENEELFTKKSPELKFQTITANRNTETVTDTLEILTQEEMQDDLTYLVVGEIKGPEAFYYLKAIQKGYTCLTSIHGITSKDAIERLRDYAKFSINYKEEETNVALEKMQVVVSLENCKVTDITEVVGNLNGTLCYKKIYLEVNK